MDIESALRQHMAWPTESRRIAVSTNAEGRVMVAVSLDNDALFTEFVAVEDKLIPWPIKPPPQRVATEGFDAHKGMGSR